MIVTFGYLLGFIGWASCFRLVVPISSWLLGAPKWQIVALMTKLFVLIFLILSILAGLSVVPMFKMMHAEGNNSWNEIFGLSFISSLLGYFTYAVFHRFSENSKSDDA